MSTYFPQGAKSEQKNISIYLLIISIFLVSCDDVKDAVSGNSLPDEAKQALDGQMEDYRNDPGWSSTYNVPDTYKIDSAKKASDPKRYDEVWCVKISPPVIADPGERIYDHFRLRKDGLLWTVEDDLDARNTWLSIGCNNW